MTEIRAQFTYSPEDYAEGQRYWQKHMAPFFTRCGIYVASAMGIFVVMTGVVLLWIHADLPIAIFVAAYGVFVLLWYGPLRSFRFRREFRKAKTLHGEKTIALKEDGFSVSSVGADSNVCWNLIGGQRETPNLFLLSVPPRLFYMFPKRAFSQTDQAAIRQLLEQKIGPGKP